MCVTVDSIEEYFEVRENGQASISGIHHGHNPSALDRVLKKESK